MTTTVFGQIGPYTIERPIGHGGMASVFLARDTRSGQSVALKIVHVGADEEAREILESEQRGADLQKRFSAVSRFVPWVFESGFTADYFYIAMEYIAGEDLSQAIHRGPLPWERAVGITMQLCEFLEEADRFETVEGSRRVLLHNDLKPRNIRLTAGDTIKVLDFGAAKALSLSRKVTRNDFGSTAYLSPECLETGDRDVHTDAWALGVLLYEMVRGRQPFRADDTRRLEQLIRSRQPAESIAGLCPPALEAIIAKLLAPYPDDRYASPAEIRADLERAISGQSTQAQAEGWGSDQAPTRRTQHDDVEAATRRTAADEPPTRRTQIEASVPTAAPIPPPAPAPPVVVPVRRRYVPRWIKTAVLLTFLAIGLNEGCVASQANRLAASVPVQDLEGLSALWPQYEELAGRSVFGGAVDGLERAIANQTKVLADRVIANYRSPVPTVRENQWIAARDALKRGVTVAPGDRTLRAALRYCEGHLLRIDGEARKLDGQQAQAQHNFTEAVVAFREALELRSDWPDPYLGLARTFIYGLEDVDRGAEALEEANKHGHHPGDRETTQLADGYRARGETLERTARTLKSMPQEREYLTRAADAYREAITRYSTIPGYGNVAVSLREAQRRLDRVEERIKELSKPSWWPWD